MIIALGSPLIYKNKYCKKNKDRFKNLKKILKSIENELTKLKITVISPTKNSNAKLCRSLWLRDTFINIDNNLFSLPNTLSKYRKPQEELKTFNITSHTLHLNMDGGDIIQHKNNIFIGIGKRTTIQSYNWLVKNFPNKNIIKIKHTALHLDCCFCVLPNNNILYSKKYIKKIPSAIKNYKINLVEDFIDKGVNPNLATNILLINKTILAIDKIEFFGVYEFFVSLGLDVILIPFYNLWRDGGGIRCLTQWINKSNLTIS